MASFTYTSDWKVSQYLSSIKANVRARLIAAVTQLGGEVANVAKGNAPHRSGRLASSISSRVVSGRTRVMGIVGVAGASGESVPYAHAIEAGFSGSEKVADYFRTIKQAFGRPITPTSVLVKAHARTVNTAAHPFLRDALAAAQQRIEDRLNAAIDGAID